MMRPFAAIENLKSNQEQLDMDGCRVAVSRQALEETLEFLEWLEGQLPGPADEANNVY